MTRIVGVVIALAGVYALTLASADPWDLVAGAILGGLIVSAFHRFLFPLPAISPGEVVRRAVFVPPLIAAAVVNVIAGTVAVARVVLSPQGPRKAGFVTIPWGERTETGLAVSAWLDTLSPGSVFIGSDDEARTWTIHLLDASDPDAVRADLERFYQRFQRPVVP